MFSLFNQFVDCKQHYSLQYATFFLILKQNWFVYLRSGNIAGNARELETPGGRILNSHFQQSDAKNEARDK